jgi:PAS domain S-box-containing protein
MNEQVRILLVEDLPSDAQLAAYEIRKTFSNALIELVETEEAFISTLQEFNPDIIVSDYQLPRFNGLLALSITLDKAPCTPVIILTGSMNEDTAVECMKAGATDYVIKEHIKRLGMALTNALEQKQIKTEKNQAEHRLRQNEQKFRALFQNHSAVKLLIDLETGRIIDANDSASKFYGWEIEDLKSMEIRMLDVHNPEAFHNQMDNPWMKVANHFETRHRKMDGSIVEVEVFSSRISVGEKECIHSIVHDITERKHAENRIIENLREKEALLREIFHRTNNNMQGIKSLLTLQATTHPATPLPRFVELISQRIDAMALVHRKLYSSNNLSRLDLGEYLRELAGLVFNACPDSSNRLQLCTNVCNLISRTFVTRNHLIPCIL